ncbi:MAG: hypothetical protein GX625_08835 [Clostridiaceae bacterium]|nr:hypothetical protein [Clostridiaceae bacterium]
MRIAFIKMAALLVLIMVTCIIIEHLLRQIPNDYSLKAEYLNEHSDSIEVLFLGGSHSVSGLNPELMRMKSFNAANFSQSLDYDLAILKEYENNWSSLKYIVIPVSVPSLHVDLENSVENWRAKNYILYFNIKISKHPKFYSEILNGLLFKNILDIYYYKTNDTDHIKCSKLGWVKEDNDGATTKILEAGKEAAMRHTKIDDDHFGMMTGVLNSILEFAEYRNISTILFTPPAYKSYTDHLCYDTWARTQKLIAEKVKDHNNCYYYDLMFDEGYDEEHFFDGDHLNSSGAVLLTSFIDSLTFSIASKL